MNFDVPADLALFAESVRDAIGDWQPPREPELGAWQEDRDDELAARLTAVGWTELWAGGELLGATVAGGIELGRAAAPRGFDHRVADAIRTRSAGRFFGRRAFGDRVPFELLAALGLAALVTIYVLMTW